MKLPTITFAAAALLALAACGSQPAADTNNTAGNEAAPTDNGTAPTENATGDKPAEGAAAPADNAAAPAGDKPEGATDPASEPAANDAKPE